MSLFRLQKLRIKYRPSHQPVVTLLDAMRDPLLFGPFFRDPATWRSWRVVIKALFGLPMTRHQRELYQELTGRTTPPTKPAKEAWIIAGRRGGKSYIAALIATYLAAFVDYTAFLSPGERGVVMLLATDRRQAQVLMKYVQAMLQEVPMLRRMITRIGAESVDLSSGVSIEVHTSSYRSVRGRTVICCVMDELAFFRSDESATPDYELAAAIRPAMSTIPTSLLLGISTPYSRRGLLWDSFDQHFGRDGDPVLVFRGSTQAFNPTVPESVIEQAYADDPAAAAAEYGAEWRSDLEAFLDPAWISAATPEGVYELPPKAGTSYIAYADPSGGSQDSFGLGIAHAEGQRVVLDVARSWRPPFDPGVVVGECADVLKSYGLQRVTGDKYAAGFVVSAFQSAGIYYQQSERTTSDVFLQCLPLFATSAITLVDNRILLNELRQLERRTGQAKDTVSHPSRGHDDVACACCGALLLAVQRTPVDMVKGAEVMNVAEARQQRDDHLAELGWAGDVAEYDDFSPFNN